MYAMPHNALVGLQKELIGNPVAYILKEKKKIETYCAEQSEFSKLRILQAVALIEFSLDYLDSTDKQ